MIGKQKYWNAEKREYLEAWRKAHLYCYYSDFNASNIAERNEHEKTEEYKKKKEGRESECEPKKPNALAQLDTKKDLRLCYEWYCFACEFDASNTSNLYKHNTRKNHKKEAEIWRKWLQRKPIESNDDDKKVSASAEELNKLKTRVMELEDEVERYEVEYGQLPLLRKWDIEEITKDDFIPTEELENWKYYHYSIKHRAYSRKPTGYMKRHADELKPAIYDTNKQKIGYEYKGQAKIYQGKGPDEKKKIRAKLRPFNWRKNKFYHEVKYKIKDDDKIYNKNGKHIGDMVEGKYVKLLQEKPKAKTEEVVAATEVDVQLSNLNLNKPANFTSWFDMEKEQHVDYKTTYYVDKNEYVLDLDGRKYGQYFEDYEEDGEDIYQFASAEQYAEDKWPKFSSYFDMEKKEEVKYETDFYVDDNCNVYDSNENQVGEFFSNTFYPPEEESEDKEESEDDDDDDDDSDISSNAKENISDEKLPANCLSWICIYTEDGEERAKKVENKTEFYLTTEGNEIYDLQGNNSSFFIGDGEIIFEEFIDGDDE